MRIFQAWGMTETSPVATYSRPREGDGEPDDAHWDGSRQAGPAAAVGRAAARRRRRRRGAVGRRSRRARSRSAARGSRARLLPRGRTDEQVRRRLAAHRRHRRGRRERLRADHRSLEGRDQVRRRVDLLGRARERADGPSGRGRGGGDRQARRALGRAPAVLRGAARGRERSAPRSCASTCAAASRSGGCPTSSRSSTEVPKTSVGKFDKKVLRGQLAEGRLEGRVTVQRPS